MKRFVYSFLVATALANAPLAARAQTGTTTTGTTALAFSQNLQVSVDGEKLDNEQYVYIGSSRCTKEAKFTFKAIGYNANPAINNLEVWASAGTSTDCSQPANRTKNTTTTSPCWLVTTEQSVTSSVTISDIPATDIFKSNSDDDSGECPQVSGNAYTVYLVPLADQTSSNPNSPPMALNYQLLKATFSLNVKIPEEPTKIKGGTGESELPVSWTKPSDFKTKSKFYVIYDTSISPDDTECADTVLKVGEPPVPQDNETVFYSDRTAGTTAYLKGLDAKGVEIGDHVAAAVIHRDQAGNDSNQSEVVCLERVDILTPLEQCDEDPSCKGEFNSCSVQPGAGKKWSLAGLALLALSLTLFARRRHV